MKHLSFEIISVKLNKKVKLIAFPLLILLLLFSISVSYGTETSLDSNQTSDIIEKRVGLVYTIDENEQLNTTYFDISNFSSSDIYISENDDLSDFSNINNIEKDDVNIFKVAKVTNSVSKKSSFSENENNKETRKNFNSDSFNFFSVIYHNFINLPKSFLLYGGFDDNGFKIYNLDEVARNSGSEIKVGFMTIMLSISFGTLFIYFMWSFILSVFPLRKSKFDDKNIEDYKLYVMVPSLNEKFVLENTIHSFFKKDGETSPLFESNLIVIDDGSDDGTDEILKRVSSEYDYDNLHIISRVLPNARQGKGEALNQGLEYIKNLESSNFDNVIIGVIDADAYMYDYDYDKVIQTFNNDHEIAMVQTAVGMNVTNNWLHKMQDMEFQSCICLISNLRNYLGNPSGGGNGQFFKLSSLKNKAQVWGNSLLEDFELSTRILLEGKKTWFLESATVYQEPVGKIKDFIVQRTRWAQGGIECIPKYGKQIIKSKSIKKRAKVEMFFYMLLPFITGIGVLGHSVSLGYNIFLILAGEYVFSFDLVILVMISMLISFVFGGIYGKRTDYGILKGILMGATVPVYGMIMVPACFRAMYRFFLGQRKWEKTEHVLSVAKT